MKSDIILNNIGVICGAAFLIMAGALTESKRPFIMAIICALLGIVMIMTFVS